MYKTAMVVPTSQACVNNTYQKESQYMALHRYSKVVVPFTLVSASEQKDTFLITDRS